MIEYGNSHLYAGSSNLLDLCSRLQSFVPAMCEASRMINQGQGTTSLLTPPPANGAIQWYHHIRATGALPEHGANEASGESSAIIGSRLGGASNVSTCVSATYEMYRTANDTAGCC